MHFILTPDMGQLSLCANDILVFLLLDRTLLQNQGD